MNRQCSSRLTTSLSFDLTWLCLDLAGCSLTDTMKIMVRNNRAIASTQAGPVAVLEDALNKVGHIIVDDTAWTNRKWYSSREVFKDSVTFQTWQSATTLYLMTKASNECDKFIKTNKLREQGQKENGIWMSRRRLAQVGYPYVGINKNPFLIYKDSPLAWAIVTTQPNLQPNLTQSNLTLVGVTR